MLPVFTGCCFNSTMSYVTGYGYVTIANVLCCLCSLGAVLILPCHMLQGMAITGGKPRNYHEIVLTQICSQATSGTRRGSFQAENWIKKGWCHVHFCFILQLRTNNGEIRQCSSV